MQGLKTIQTSGFYGDTMRWFIGTVIRNTGDPLELGRLKIRIVGIHDNPEIEDADLPWASVVIPTTEVGMTHGRGPRISPGNQVFGIFLDGTQSQQPLVIGSIPYTLIPTKVQIQQAAERGGSFDESYSSGYEGGGGNVLSAGNTKAEQAFNYFVSDIGGGYTAEQSAGIVGNLMAESGNFADDVISTDRRGDGGRAHGIAQWHPNRWNPFLDWCRRNNQNPYQLSSQLRWVTLELDSTESRAKSALQNTSRPDHAAIAFMRRYERPQILSGNSQFRDPPNNPNGNLARKRAGEDERVSYAEQVYNTYAFVSGAAGTPTGPTSRGGQRAWSTSDAENVEALRSFDASLGEGSAGAQLSEGERAYARSRGYL